MRQIWCFIMLLAAREVFAVTENKSFATHPFHLWRRADPPRPPEQSEEDPIAAAKRLVRQGQLMGAGERDYRQFPGPNFSWTTRKDTSTRARSDSKPMPNERAMTVKASQPDLAQNFQSAKGQGNMGPPPPRPPRSPLTLQDLDLPSTASSPERQPASQMQASSRPPRSPPYKPRGQTPHSAATPQHMQQIDSRMRPPELAATRPSSSSGVRLLRPPGPPSNSPPDLAQLAPIRKVKMTGAPESSPPQPPSASMSEQVKSASNRKPPGPPRSGPGRGK